MSTNSQISGSGVPTVSGPPVNADGDRAATSSSQQPESDDPSRAGDRQQVSDHEAAQAPANAATVSAPSDISLSAPAQPVPIAERIPVHVSTEETFGQKFGHWGPTATSAASILLTIFVWFNAKHLSEQQIELQKQQTKLQSAQVQSELAVMRSKYFDDLMARDENKKTLAEIGLAGHGADAMPVVHLALGVKEEKIRESAVNVVYHLFHAQMKPEGRQQLLQHLMGEFNSPNKYLRIGVVQSLVKIEPLLEPGERQQVMDFLDANVDPRHLCSDQEGRDTVQEAAKFVSNLNADPTTYLLAIARCPRCGDGWLQAMLKLSTTAISLTPAQRVHLRQRILQLRREIPEHLRENISERDLAAGTGFVLFRSSEQTAITFDEFKRKVEEKFDALLKSLGEQ